MVQTEQLEADMETGSSYWDCFKGTSRRRTEICIMVYVIQEFRGNPVGYAIYFFEYESCELN